MKNHKELRSLKIDLMKSVEEEYDNKYFGLSLETFIDNS
jgi:hypothetical protein